MSVTTTVDGSKATIAISGWLNVKTAPELAKALEALDDVEELMIDFANLEYVSSAGLRELVTASRKTDGHLTIVNASPDVLAILELAGFNQLAQIVQEPSA